MINNEFNHNSKGKYIFLAILVVIFLLARLLILFSSIDRVHFEEELYRGNITKELISGPTLPFFDYQITQWEGGSLVNGVLAVPFFLLFGESLFSLKLVGLFFSTGILILWYLFLDRFFHRKIAVLASLLFILSPQICTAVSISAEGSHFQSSFFSILAIFIFYKIFFEKEKRRLFVLLGLVSGFAIFFDYIFSVTLFTILLFWFIFDKKFLFRKSFFIFAAFFLLGFSPWIYYNLTHNFEGLLVLDHPVLYWFTQNSLPDSLIRFKNLLVTEIANSFNARDAGFLNHQFLSRAYYLIFVLSFCGLFFLNRKSITRLVLGVIPSRRFKVLPKDISRDTFLIVFPVIFSIIFSLTSFEFYFIDKKIQPICAGYRFLFPLYPFIFAIIAIFLYRMTLRNRYFLISYFRSGLIIVLFSLGLAANLFFVSTDNLGNYFAYKIYKGYNYFDLGRQFCFRFYDNVDRAIQLTKKVDKRFRRYCYEGMGWGIRDPYRYPYEMTAANYIKNIGNKIDKQYQPYAYERLGRVMGYNDKIAKELKDNLDVRYRPYFYRGFGAKEAKMLVYDLQAYLRLKDRINEEYQPYFHEGIGIELYEILVNDTERFIHFIHSLDGQLKLSLYRGMAEGQEYYQYSYDKFGFGLGRIGYNIENWNKIINKIEDEYKPYCYQRLGIEIGWRFIHDIKKYRLFLEQASEQYRPSLYKGLGIGIGWRFGYDINGCIGLIKEADQKYRTHIYEGLGIGVARRYSYQLDEWVNETVKIPSDYKPYFDRGVKKALMFRKH